MATDEVLDILENKHGDKCDVCKKHPKFIVQTANNLLCEDCALKKGLVETSTEIISKEVPKGAKTKYKV